MAEEQDRESRTEEATEKRVSDAVDKGNVPKSREATLFGSIGAIYAALVFLGAWMVESLAQTLQVTLSGVGTFRIDDREAAASYLVTLVRDAGAPVMVVMAVIAGGSLLTTLLQNVPSASGERISPKGSRISPAAGWSRLFGRAGMAEFLKAFLKLAAVSLILWMVFKRDLPHFAYALASEPILLAPMLQDMASSALAPLLMLSLVLAIADITWARIRWRRELRMTRQEIKEEMKEAEGDHPGARSTEKLKPHAGKAAGRQRGDYQSHALRRGAALCPRRRGCTCRGCQGCGPPRKTDPGDCH